MSTLKRKRTYGPSTFPFPGYSQGAKVLTVSRPMFAQSKRRKGFRPGADRVSGYYGRYSKRDGELKFHDVDLDDAVVAAAGTITGTINAIAQGVTESTRVGRKCTLKSINWRWRTYAPEADAVANPAQPDIIRIILYLDKQCNGAAAAVTDILETANYNSFRNLANSGRFTILLDRYVNVNYLTLASDGAGVVSSSENTRAGSYYKRCNIPIEFSSTTGVITEIKSNNLGVCLLSVNGTGGFESKIRLRFSDQ